MKHTVHLYAVVIIKVENVEADDDRQAAEKAERYAAFNGGLYRLFDLEQKAPAHVTTSYGEEILGALVDHEGDTEFGKSSYVQLLPDAGVDRYKSEVKCEN